MCGRFTLRSLASELVSQFDLGHVSDRQLTLLAPRYNIAPTQEIAAVRMEGAARAVVPLRWGLIPSWSKDRQKAPPLINARGETVASKPSFRSSFRRRRCLILADGFYEWQPATGSASRGKKQPYYIHRADGAPFAFAGLWERWSGGETGSGLAIESCTIITTEANDTMRPIHERMPVILAPGDHEPWLDAELQDAEELQYLVAPCGNDELVAEPVGTYVNSVKHDGPACIEIQRTLFDE